MSIEFLFILIALLIYVMVLGLLAGLSEADLLEPFDDGGILIWIWPITLTLAAPVALFFFIGSSFHSLGKTIKKKIELAYAGKAPR